MTEADAAALVADNDERRETEAPTAFHNLGHTVDVNQLVDEFAVALFAIAVFSTFTRHVPFLPSKF